MLTIPCVVIAFSLAGNQIQESTGKMVNFFHFTVGGVIIPLPLIFNGWQH